MCPLALQRLRARAPINGSFHEKAGPKRRVRGAYASSRTRRCGLIGGDIEVGDVDLGEIVIWRIPANHARDLGIDREDLTWVKVLA